jgi:hypothetical protein
MADEELSYRRSYEDPPTVPAADLVRSVAAVVASREEVTQVRLRMCVELLDGVEIARRPQIAVLFRDQPEPSDLAFRVLTRELVAPLERLIQPEGGTVMFTFPAARRIYQQCGYIVFSRD